MQEDVLVATELNLDMNIYINEQNQVIKQALNYDGQFQIENEELPFSIVMDINYTNMGADIEITAPSIEVTLKIHVYEVTTLY